MKKILYIIGTVLLLVGCAKTDLGSEWQTEMQKVVLSVSPDLSYIDENVEPMSAQTRAMVSVYNYVLEVCSDNGNSFRSSSSSRL